MAKPPMTADLRTRLVALDPRRSLLAGTVWMIVGLAAAFSIAASLWVGGLARQIVFEQHVRRLSLETDQLAANVAAAVRARLGALQVTGGFLRSGAPPGAPAQLREVFTLLERGYPEAGWLGVADLSGKMLATSGALASGNDVADQAWYRAGRRGIWLGVIAASGGATSNAVAAASPSSLGDLAAPVRDATGEVIGVVAARLSWPPARRTSLGAGPDADPLAGRPLLLDREGLVLAGPPAWLGHRWTGGPITVGSDASPGPPRFETLPEGRRYLITRAPVPLDDQAPPARWFVQLGESKQRVYERADALAARIVWVSACLGAITALAGALGAHRLTGRLQRLTRSVSAVRQHGDGALEVPAGHDEAAQLGSAFATLLADLRQERSELRALGSELERRVELRTREVERLAEESRYAAVVRERLKIARDLHDTLAHSMMAMLSEIRILRRLAVHDPESLAEELERAEQVALDGLNEARTAITQMRVNVVRDTGLGAALAKAVAAFSDETGLPVDFRTDADAARFGDERAETAYRMAEEALRNVARHAQATRVGVSLLSGDGTRCELRIEDDGVGFDPESPHDGHFGLVGLREQAQLMGAELRIESAPDRGTRLTVTWKTSPERL